MSRNMIVRQWLAPGPTGRPKLMLLRDTTPAMQQEFILYKKRVTAEVVREDVVAEHDHLMSCAGYLAAYGPEYVPPDQSHEPYSPALAAWRKMEAGRGPKQDYSYMGPGACPDETLEITEPGELMFN
jgi:hypothetical protein